MRRLALLLLPALLFTGSAESIPLTCSYDSYSWNVHQKKAVNFAHVSHPYSQLAREEVDPHTGCTVCSEDQVEVNIAGLPPFPICRKLAPELKPALTYLIRSGVHIERIIGYRPGKSRGNTDVDGNRTIFSNHAFGTALDINPAHNGLYGNCIRFGPQCRLLKGGAWRPGSDPASLVPDGEVVQVMRSIGLQWGGEIEGRQKDFMHFSISGY